MDMSHCLQSSIYGAELKYEMFYSLNQEKHPILYRIGAPAIALATAGMTGLTKIATVGETIVKALGNIFGSPFSDKCFFLKGIKQLFVTLPCALAELLVSPVIMLIDFAVTTVKLLWDPNNQTEELEHEYNIKCWELNVASSDSEAVKTIVKETLCLVKQKKHTLIKDPKANKPLECFNNALYYTEEEYKSRNETPGQPYYYSKNADELMSKLLQVAEMIETNAEFYGSY